MRGLDLATIELHTIAHIHSDQESVQVPGIKSFACQLIVRDVFKLVLDGTGVLEGRIGLEVTELAVGQRFHHLHRTF